MPISSAIFDPLRCNCRCEFNREEGKTNDEALGRQQETEAMGLSKRERLLMEIDYHHDQATVLLAELAELELAEETNETATKSA